MAMRLRIPLTRKALSYLHKPKHRKAGVGVTLTVSGPHHRRIKTSNTIAVR